MGDLGFNTALAAETPNEGAEIAFVAADDLRSAMRKNGVRYPLRLAPVKLRADRRMPDRYPLAVPQDGPGHRRTVTEIHIDAAQRGFLVTDRRHVRHVEYASPAGADAVADGRSAQRMLDWEGLESDIARINRHAQGHIPTLRNWIGSEQRPSLFRCINRAEGPRRKSTDMVGVTMRQNDRVRTQLLKAAEPISSAIDENSGVGFVDKQHAVPAMPPGSQGDVRPRSNKG